MGNKLAAAAVVVIVILGIGYFLMTGSARPMSTDLSVIGKGKPVLVLVYENYTPSGAEALASLKKVRGDYESRVEFVVADLGVPDGRAFAEGNGLDNSQVMLMGPAGKPLTKSFLPADERSVRELLDAKLAVVE